MSLTDQGALALAALAAIAFLLYDIMKILGRIEKLLQKKE
jgi:hypothetical protein